ncbi:pirin family protein [Alteribacter natronophilus]|uniref:pirin family protein n=1 Tax=Alteribacter natronophilus TaxID=2583810 RepID=UPI00110D6D7A|nr:pirin-like C-terminal cupin domain-containing protein [Alteribacter natronophilus]TMW70957.1 pirin family protein [Alteribacter natronophilus]
MCRYTCNQKELIIVSDLYQRRVTDHWYVKYEEAAFPFIQKGWVLPAGQWEKFDPFILMAEDWFKKGAFSDHPHRGFQTLTYVIDGRVEHIDNGGGHGILEPGDVQYMNAGWYARHAEEGVDDDIAHTLQLWINLPAEKRKSETIYQDVHSENMPEVTFKGGRARVIAGDTAGKRGPLESVVPITMTEVHLDEGAEWTLPLPADHNAFLYVLSGDMTFGENEVRLAKHGAGTLSFQEDAVDGEESGLTIRANARRSKVLVYSGKPIREEIVPYGPFVMNTMEEIRDAYRDFNAGKFPAPRA